MSTWLRQRRNSGRGFTMAELVMVCAILGILAALILPVAKFTIKRSKEASLRLSLREMRNAIDEYKRFSDSGLLVVELGTDGYPSDLEILVEGVDMVGQVRSRAKFLRSIPIDPATDIAGSRFEWLEAGVRSLEIPSTVIWGREEVVFTAEVFAKRWHDIWPHAEGTHMVTGNHFLQEDSGAEIGALLVDFARREAPAEGARA